MLTLITCLEQCLPGSATLKLLFFLLSVLNSLECLHTKYILRDFFFFEKDYLFEIESMIWRGRESQTDSLLSAEPDLGDAGHMGLYLMTLRSGPTLKPRAHHLTKCVTWVPPNRFFFLK